MIGSSATAMRKVTLAGAQRHLSAAEEIHYSQENYRARLYSTGKMTILKYDTAGEAYHINIDNYWKVTDCFKAF